MGLKLQASWQSPSHHFSFHCAAAHGCQLPGQEKWPETQMELEMVKGDGRWRRRWKRIGTGDGDGHGDGDGSLSRPLAQLHQLLWAESFSNEKESAEAYRKVEGGYKDARPHIDFSALCPVCIQISWGHVTETHCASRHTYACKLYLCVARPSPESNLCPILSATSLSCLCLISFARAIVFGGVCLDFIFAKNFHANSNSSLFGNLSASHLFFSLSFFPNNFCCKEHLGFQFDPGACAAAGPLCFCALRPRFPSHNAKTANWPALLPVCDIWCLISITQCASILNFLHFCSFSRGGCEIDGC